MRKPWAKLPADFHVLVGKLPIEARGTAYALFELAACLGTPRLDTGPRATARELCLPSTTFQRHRDQLLDLGFLHRTLGGELFVPQVILVSDRFPSRRTDEPSPKNEQHHDGRTGKRHAETAELPGLWGGGAGPPTDQSGPPTDHKRTEERTSKNLRYGVDFDEGEDSALPFAGDLMLAVPDSIDNPNHRYLIAKLAALSPSWARLLDSPRDRALLKRLYSEHRSALLAALEQARPNPNGQKNAGAWLTATVPLIEREEATA